MKLSKPFAVTPWNCTRPINFQTEMSWNRYLTSQQKISWCSLHAQTTMDRLQKYRCCVAENAVYDKTRAWCMATNLWLNRNIQLMSSLEKNAPFVCDLRTIFSYPSTHHVRFWMAETLYVYVRARVCVRSYSVRWVTTVKLWTSLRMGRDTTIQCVRMKNGTSSR